MEPEVDAEAEELGELIDEFEKIKEMPNNEVFRPVANRQEKRAMARRQRRQAFVNKPGGSNG